ncbi:MAG: hypothetical protein A2W99_08935 [Bacteroidetes bacterium GWF2_33_16]|nr:MAG: hypothetical protein A2X00_00220 [Bacteroidetes bacterium GWE2_32_14]OFY05620.1 MAG: hypothetical protein A2W99_08935 [Bacteroidetes bacterium GWF2_33_16]
MKKTTLLFFLIVAMSLFSNYLFAVTAYPEEIKFKQPDGKSLTIQLMGDEFIHWAKTSDGYTIMFNKDGFYEYAILDQKGDMIPSGIIATDPQDRKSNDQQFVSQLNKELFFSESQVSLLKSIRQMREQESKASKAFPTTGTRKLVCILMGFKDKAFTKTQADFNNLYNQVGYSAGGATGSVKDFYLESSYGQFDLSVTVAGPYTAANNMSYYGANDASGNDVNPRALVTEAVNAADASVNFADFDNDNNGSVDGVYIIYAGYGEEAGGGANAIWAHAWSITPVTKDGKTISSYSCSAELSGSSGSTITAIGVICHEFGHVLGSPDYYDVDYTTGGNFIGTGNWDLMASGSWNNNGVTPAQHNAYTKVYYYSWATATLLSSAQDITVTNSVQNKSFYRINSTTTNEFWLIENRQIIGFDANIPGHGLIIYHVHSGIGSVGNSINATYPQRMYPVCANATTNPGTTPASYGTINGGGCPFPGTSAKTSFTDATTPNMKSWAGALTAKPITNIVENTTTKTITFSFMDGGTTVVVPTITTTAASSITTTTATSGGNITSNGGANVTAAGVCYATTANPTTANSKVSTTTTSGAFTSSLTGLTASTTYYVRAYATNSAGTAYGSQISFTTGGGSSLNLPVTQNFASTMPVGWTTQNTGTSITERWSMSNTANAGGAAYEAKCTYQNVNPGTTRLITPAINTVGVSQVTFSFKHMLDTYGTGVTLRVQTSNNKTTWTNTTWSVSTTATNIAATTVNVTVTTNLNSATTYFAIVADGNLYQIDYWYVDNISITTGSAGTIPTVTTTAASSITASSATSGGNVTSAGSATVTERGICYSTSSNPTTSNSKVVSGSGTGSFTANISGLAASTTYYVRAYAINSVGTAYGSQVSFTTSSSGGGTTSDVTVGTGTSTQGYPINCYYGYERSASIYTAAEIGKVGSISKLAWYPTLTTTNNVPIKIYVKHTTAIALGSSTWANSISGATLVYSGTMAGTTANAWKVFTLSTAFNFTGGSNNLVVLVETNYGGTGAGSSTGSAVRYTAKSSGHMYIRADNSAPTGNGTVTSYRPNIKITITTSSKSSGDEINESDNVLSISEIVNVYPNPTNSIITIESEKEIKSIEVYSITGAKVYSNYNIAVISSNVDLSNFSNGTYLVIVSDGVNRHKMRVIKY